MSFWLPHEIVATLMRNATDSEHLYDRQGLDPLSLKHLVECEAKAGDRLVAVGLWGDAAPCNWDRTESLQVFSLNLPGLSGDHRTLRIPITALSKKSVATDETYEDLLGVVAWSLQYLALGTYPPCRHNDGNWQPGNDTWRRKLAGKRLGVKGALVEVRGDWAFFKEVFLFPGWREKGLCCWRCSCTLDQVRIRLQCSMYVEETYDLISLGGRRKK